MFKKLAADALGISDIGKIISPEDFEKTDSDDYVMHEEGERIFFLIKSKSDEYCFTNQALIHLDGASAASKKKMLYRHSYSKNAFRKVKLETAGNIDLDVELKFHLGEISYSIDVTKKQIEQLKDLYKALLKIEEIQAENHHYHEMSQRSLELTLTTLGRVNKADIKLDEEARKLNDFAWGWMQQSRDNYVRKDFSEIFLKFINN